MGHTCLRMSSSWMFFFLINSINQAAFGVAKLWCYFFKHFYNPGIWRGILRFTATKLIFIYKALLDKTKNVFIYIRSEKCTAIEVPLTPAKEKWVQWKIIWNKNLQKKLFLFNTLQLRSIVKDSTWIIAKNWFCRSVIFICVLVKTELQIHVFLLCPVTGFYWKCWKRNQQFTASQFKMIFPLIHFLGFYS